MLTVHIVYTPGTVGLLLPFVDSLLAYSPFRYCLVANGCSAEERADLAAAAGASPRLDVAVLDGATRPHSEMMEWALARTDDPHLAFVDSDILAVAPFGEPVQAALGEVGVFSGCLQPSVNEREREARHGRAVMGRHLSVAGLGVGTTFFVVYDRQAVLRIREAFGVGFGAYDWDALPAAVRARFDEAGLRFERYDTAKALNLLMRLADVPAVHDRLPALVHIGGVSLRAERVQRPSPPPAQRSRVRHLLSRGKHALVTWRRRSQRPASPGGPTSWVVRKRTAADYFSASIEALQAGETPPPVPAFGDPEVQHEMERIAGAIEAFYRARRR